MATLGYIQVTRKCNQKCRFCSNPPTGKTLSLKEAISYIDDYIKKGYDGVIFTGGEPTLSPHLPRLLSYCFQKGIYARIITNGQRIADFNYLKLLKKTGLYHLHLSIYSVKPEIQNFLTQNKNSFTNIKKALENLKKIGGITVNINTVINKYNADHLDKNVIWLTKRFPFLRHFVWNNLDPLMSRALKNPDTIPRLSDFELSLHRAMEYLSKTGRSFRVEKVPLCYMKGFEHCSTETRRIVKKEKMSTHFLDKKGFIEINNWVYNRFYSKAECCKRCSLNDICAGLYQMDKYYASRELHPVSVDKNKIIRKILEEN